MTMLLAHIFGMPVEEFVLPWIIGGSGAGTVMVFASVSALSRLTAARRK